MSSIKEKLGYIPSHKMDGKYAILMETSGEECESWLYFIRYDGNENNLKYLHNQLEQVNFYVIDELSTFDLDIEHLVSATTAKEMTKVDLNHNSFHRKFDGELKKIDLGFGKKDGNETKICKTFDLLGFGQIENFIDDEDLDEEDLCSDSECSTDTENDSVSEDDSDDEKIKTREDLRKILRDKIKSKRE